MTHERPGLAPRETGLPCVICGLQACTHIESVQVPFGAPIPVPPRVFVIPANVYRNERLAYAVGEVISFDLAVAEGFVEWEPMPDPPGKGKRKGERARRPSEDRMRRKAEDRAKPADKGGDR